MNPKFLNLVTIVCFVGLILGIAGVSSADKNHAYRAGTLVKSSMAIFIIVFVTMLGLAVWLYLSLRYTIKRFQKKLFVAIAISSPFLLVRIIYSALSDYTDNSKFTVLSGDATTYLCMDVLEEIIAMVATMALGLSAVREKDFMKPNYTVASSESRDGEEQAGTVLLK
jgi:hypothetical protein